MYSYISRMVFSDEFHKVIYVIKLILECDVNYLERLEIVTNMVRKTEDQIGM